MLDALALRHAPANWKRVCSISWDAWQEIGMAADESRLRASIILPDPSNGPVGEAIDHPMWQYRLKVKNRMLFTGVIRPSEHWVLDEHRLNGTAVLPGTGILELILAAHQNFIGSDDPVTLQDIAFRRFVDVPEEGLVIWLFLTIESG
jgi:hypothetical protein